MVGKSQHGIHRRERKLPNAANIQNLLQGVQNQPGTTVDMPKPPPNLNKRAVEHWNYMLVEVGHILKRSDAPTLASYCLCYAKLVDAGIKVNKQGEIIKNKKTGNMYRNPWADVERSMLQEVKMYAALFGLSPLDRAKMGKPGGGGTPKANAFDEF